MKTETLVTLVIIFLVVAITNWFTPYDETDDIGNKERSGMVLLIDYGTGCQYLGTRQIWGNSSLTPRLDSNGTHICN